ncbi:MAG: hypothetical protein H0V88_04590 [Pyrinomonadaceae bacterium]|nr:hypothetical protein [Pyrinomonadaceae bacterium]
MKPFLYTLVIAACLSLMLWAQPTTTTAKGVVAGASGNGSVPLMPEQCRPGKTSPETLGWRWKPGTVVKVYFLKDNFTEAETDALAHAVKNWNDALREINSRVFLVDSGTREEVATSNASITVLRGIPRVKKRVGETRFYSMSNGVIRLVITINPIVTDLNALTSLMTHELGHSLGLADCYKCRRGTTAMAAFKSHNQGNDVHSPSACDKYVVALGYANETNTQARVEQIQQGH